MQKSLKSGPAMKTSPSVKGNDGSGVGVGAATRAGGTETKAGNGSGTGTGTGTGFSAKAHQSEPAIKTDLTKSTLPKSGSLARKDTKPRQNTEDFARGEKVTPIKDNDQSRIHPNVSNTDADHPNRSDIESKVIADEIPTDTNFAKSDDIMEPEVEFEYAPSPDDRNRSLDDAGRSNEPIEPELDSHQKEVQRLYKEPANEFSEEAGIKADRNGHNVQRSSVQSTAENSAFAQTHRMDVADEINNQRDEVFMDEEDPDAGGDADGVQDMSNVNATVKNAEVNAHYRNPKDRLNVDNTGKKGSIDSFESAFGGDGIPEERDGIPETEEAMQEERDLENEGERNEENEDRKDEDKEDEEAGGKPTGKRKKGLLLNSKKIKKFGKDKSGNKRSNSNAKDSHWHPVWKGAIKTFLRNGYPRRQMSDNAKATMCGITNSLLTRIVQSGLDIANLSGKNSKGRFGMNLAKAGVSSTIKGVLRTYSIRHGNMKIEEYDAEVARRSAQKASRKLVDKAAKNKSDELGLSKTSIT